MPLLLLRRSALLLALSASLGLAACSRGDNGANANAMGWNTVTALKVTDTAVGSGAQADATKTVSVNYTGYLFDVRATADSKGTQFDTSVGKSPFTFTLGTGAVIPGFDQGIAGMKVGGKRTITIPAAMAYGSAGAGGAVPPNAALVFDVELTAVN
ncbi:FKBP-type peptidyl-prolyl cis-trans isomerase [Roseateles sp. NT4]|uniref:FKBP-type peptidyl-prolyl cis-trans isomerase n=1 Tax=Roseateles sp. NT4 TaxID=3453715 RepID=UPI003EEF2B71